MNPLLYTKKKMSHELGKDYAIPRDLINSSKST